MHKLISLAQSLSRLRLCDPMVRPLCDSPRSQTQLCDWTELITDSQPISLPSLLKMLCWNPSGSLALFRAQATYFLAGPCNKRFSTSNSDVSGLTVQQAHELVLTVSQTKSHLTCISSQNNLWSSCLSLSHFKSKEMKTFKNLISTPILCQK